MFFAIRWANDHFESDFPVITTILVIMGAMALTDDGMVVQATGNGIQVRKGGESLQLMNPGKHVIYSSDAQGSMRARSVDPDTGYVTINNVDYAE